MKPEFTPTEERLIDGWIRGTLSEDEVRELQQLRAASRELDEEVSFRESLVEGLEDEQRARWKKQLQDVEIKPAKPSLKWTAVAASLLLLLSLGLWIGLQPPEGQQLYAEYFTPYPNVLAPVERGDDATATTFEKAMIAYQQKQYEQALELLMAIPENTSGREFYTAQTLMALNRPEQAVPYLQQVLDNPAEANLHPQAQGSKALCYLYLGDTETAQTLLQHLLHTSPSPPKYARKLLYELE